MPSPLAPLDAALGREIAKCYADPLRFVTFAYPWGKPGTTLAPYTGPDVWQTELLRAIGDAVRARKFDGVHPVDPIRVAVSSGHGTGKSTLSAWLVNWLMATRPDSQGTVTANTFPQLQAKTWAAIQRWTKLSACAHWFDVSGTAVRATMAPESWFCTAQTCREENSEAFAGQHAANSTSWYLFDEASAIPRAIWDVAEGGLTDGEPQMFVFGNATRSDGRFYEVCFGSGRNRWLSRTVDSRDAAFTNKALIAQWIEDYGEDSDFVRVRVRGLPPRAGDQQFIATDLVADAQRRRDGIVLPDEPLVAGLDVARGGGDSCVIRFRRGTDAYSIRPIRLPGEEMRDSMRLVSIAVDVLDRDYDGRKVTTLFVDGTGVGGPVADRLRQLGHRNVVEVQFGAEAPDRKMANMRAHMWARMREWLPKGMIDRDPQLDADLTGPGYAHDKKDRLVLESKESMKKRGLASTDDGDALALTFAMPVRSAEVLVTPLAPASYSDPAMSWMG